MASSFLMAHQVFAAFVNARDATPDSSISRAVDLSEQFLDKVPMQTGYTCAFYAAAQLVESECYIRTGQHIKLSEPYLMYRFFRQKVQSISDEDLANLFKDKNALLGEKVEMEFPEKILGSINSDGVLTQSEFASSFQWVDLFSSLREKWTVKPPLETKSFMMGKMDQFASKSLSFLNPSLVAGGVAENNIGFYADALGYVLYTSNNGLQKCLKKKVRIHTVESSSQTATQILDQGRSFICTSTFVSENKKVTIHSFVVSGYRLRKSPRRKHGYPDGIEYKIRDSYSGTSHWGATLGSATLNAGGLHHGSNCDGGITYIE